MGRKLIIPGADFSQNGMPELNPFVFYLGGFYVDGTYNDDTNSRARTNQSDILPSLEITNTTSVVITDVENIRWAYSIRNANNTAHDVTGLQEWRSTPELTSSELSAFVGKYLVIVAKFTDERVISDSDIAYLESKIFYKK